MSGGHSLDHNVFTMDSATCKFLGDDDMFWCGFDSIFNMGGSRMVERHTHRIVRYPYRHPACSSHVGSVLAGRILLHPSLRLRPAEEIFWRGYIQKSLSSKWTPTIGFIITTLVYSLVHISKFNFMLIMAAAVAGFIWGLAYRFFPERLGAIIISHALWDCAVFIWFPIM